MKKPFLPTQIAMLSVLLGSMAVYAQPADSAAAPKAQAEPVQQAGPILAEQPTLAEPKAADNTAKEASKVATEAPKDSSKVELSQEKPVVATEKVEAEKKAEPAVKDSVVAAPAVTEPVVQDSAAATGPTLVETKEEPAAKDSVATQVEAIVEEAVKKTEEAPAVTEPVAEVEEPKEEAKSGSALSDAEKQAEAFESEVVIGYGTTKKTDLTGGVTTVNAEDLQKNASFGVTQALQGKAAGVNVTANSGQPGAGLTVRVRGVGSYISGDPLYVVNGLPVRDISHLNPNDIEAISVLKDASSTAIYGSRGANGVILITTKKGKNSDAKEEGTITYNGYYGLSKPSKSPDLLTSTEWVTLRNEALINLGEPSEVILPDTIGGNVDWFDLVTRDDALIQSHSLAFSNAGSNYNYYLSALRKKEEGIILGSDAELTTLRLKGGADFKKWLSVGTNVSISKGDVNYANDVHEYRSIHTNTLAKPPVGPISDSTGYLEGNYARGYENPLGVIENSHFNKKRLLVNGNAYADFKIVDGLTFRSSLGVDYENGDSTRFTPKYDFGGSNLQGSSMISKTNTQNYFWLWENTLRFEKVFDDVHNLKLLGGYSVEHEEWEFIRASRNGTPGNEEHFHFLDAGDPTTAQALGTKEEDGIISYFSRISYDYDYKYFFNTSFRADGSSRFAEDKRWTQFPAVSAAWKISEENFMKNLSAVENLKVRAGWGKSGNDNIPRYQYTTTTTTNQSYVLNDDKVNGKAFLSAGNPSIQWEESATTNAGIDLVLLGGQIELIADMYIKQTDSALIKVGIPEMAGIQTAPFSNAMSIENKGIDLALNLQKKMGKLRLGANATFSMYKNEVTETERNTILWGPEIYLAYRFNRVEQGREVGEFYGYKTDGLIQSADDPAIARQAGSAPGDIKFVDVNGDGTITDADRTYIGSPHPDFTYGFGFDVAYEDDFGTVDFHAFFQGSEGNEIVKATNFFNNNFNAEFNLDNSMLGRWTGAGTTNDPSQAKLGGSSANMNFADWWVEDGSYVRLKTIQVGYSFPKSMEDLANFRIYGGVRNLLTWTNYSGLEPEVGMGRYSGSSEDVSDETRSQNVEGLDFGIDRGTYPQPITFFMGIDLSI